MDKIDKSNKTLRLTLTAVLIALSTALSFVKIWQMPLGGAVTLFSLLPVCLISVVYGTKKAFIPCVLYGAIQMLTGGVFGWGLTPAVLIGSIVFDYILAFGSMSLAGVFRSMGEKGIYLGVSAALFLRFLCHFVSGCVFFKCFDYFGGNIYIYSLCYNGGFMLPETALTALGAFFLFRMKPVKDFILK